MQLYILLTALVFSAFFSGSETAFISANLTRLEVLVRQKIRGAKFAYKFLRRPENFLITILAGNNIAVVVFSSCFAIILKDSFPESIIIFLSSTILLIFGEILPKSVFRDTANRWVIILVVLMKPVHWLLYPITNIFEKSSRFLIKLFQAEIREEIDLVSKRELELFFKQSSNLGIIENEKSLVINKVFRLSKSRIKEIMIPRIDIVAIEKNSTIAEAKSLFLKTGLSQLLVYESEPDNIIGKINIKDLFNYPQLIREIIHPVLIVPERKSGYEMLLEFKRTKTGIAAVIDEYGSLSGLVAMEDIVEELIGNIIDEHDSTFLLYKKIRPGNYLVHSRLEIEDANEILYMNLPGGDYETVGGFILTHLGRIPKAGEIIELPEWHVLVSSAAVNKIEWLKFSKRKR